MDSTQILCLGLIAGSSEEMVLKINTREYFLAESRNYSHVGSFQKNEWSSWLQIGKSVGSLQRKAEAEEV